MTCGACGGSTTIVSSRADGDIVVRYRRCRECGRSIYTTEMELPDSREEFRQIDRYYQKKKTIERIKREGDAKRDRLR